MERKWLKDRRLNKKLTQDEVSKKALISRSFYTHLENGNKNPSVDVAKRLGQILSFDWTIFFAHECSFKEQNEVV
ncbi:transcriptional regulator [Bacillaceae bacterium SAOS 7]|nr:transcriptional regulator [Bacillaceae bacterium SAOS 7]